jgi:hypothetical protein
MIKAGKIQQYRKAMPTEAHYSVLYPMYNNAEDSLSV